MPRPRKPTLHLETKGAFKKNPNRKRTDPPTRGELGEPPEWMSDIEKQCWKDLEVELPIGIPTCSDRGAFEIMSVIRAELMVHKNEVGVSRLTLYSNLLNKFGGTASGRASIAAPAEKKKDNPFAALG